MNVFFFFVSFGATANIFFTIIYDSNLSNLFEILPNFKKSPDLFRRSLVNIVTEVRKWQLYLWIAENMWLCENEIKEIDLLF